MDEFISENMDSKEKGVRSQSSEEYLFAKDNKWMEKQPMGKRLPVRSGSGVNAPQ